MATQELMRPQAVNVPARQAMSAEAMEKVLIQGNLASLTPLERVAYYRSVCDSVGLNPLTRPFEYLNLNGKLQLYAKKDCAEQLRQIHNISVTIKSREVIEGVFVVTAHAANPNGRQDESIGAVPIEGTKGENRSNAMMKAETKAKRRVTMAICGLAFLDETEVDSVRGASHVKVDVETGEILSGTREVQQSVAEAKIAAMQAGASAEQASAVVAEYAPDGAVDETPYTLHDDIVNNPTRVKKSSTPFNVLGHFRDIKKRFDKINMVDGYYDILKRYGVEKSNQFGNDENGMAQARACYKELSLVVQDLETAALGVPDK